MARLRVASRAVTAAMLTALLVVGASSASGADVGGGEVAPVGVRVERVSLAPDGASSLAFSVFGLPTGETIALDDIAIVEDGRVVPDLAFAGEATGRGGDGPAVILAVDTSGSAAGEPLQAAVAAGQALVRVVDEAGFATGLVEFSDDVTVHARLTDPADVALARLGGLEASGATRLYDAVTRSTRILAEHDGPRDLVVFSDGVDNGSQSTLDDVRQLAAAGDVRVTAVALESEDFDLAPLQAIAAATGGRVLRVTDPAELIASFEAVAESLTTRFEVRWTAVAVPVPPTELSYELRVQTSVGPATDRFVALNPRTPAITEPRVYSPAGPTVPLLTGPLGLVVAGGATFTAVLLMGALMLTGAGERRRRERLAKRLEGWDGLGDAPEDAVVAAASISERAADAMARVPTPAGFEERLANLLERADWPMRPGEFQLVTIGSMLGGLVVPLVLLRNVPVALVGLMLGAAGPYLVLQLAVGRRARKFTDQLPSVLSLLAGALRAGHSFHTALEGTIRETDEPAHSELRRAAVEHRLGRPVAEALRGVADRMHSDDLRWVVTAITIQQDVGGNLAELLDNVAATLRDRASLIRTVQALSAEGRISAWIIGAMPFGMFVTMSIINPEYTALLYTTGLGRVMLVAAALMLVLGVVWLRNIVQPRY